MSLSPSTGSLVGERPSERAMQTAMQAQKMKNIINSQSLQLLEQTLAGIQNDQAGVQNCAALSLHAASTGNVPALALIAKYHGGGLHVKDADGDTTLQKAVIGGFLEAAKLLLQLKIPINHRDNGGFTALHHACSLGHVSIVRLLVDNQADVNTRDEDNVTPLHQAVSTGQEEIVKILVSSNADINAQDSTGSTPLHIAAFENQLRLGKLLLDSGADVNLQDSGGCTPLHTCCFLGFPDFAAFLLEKPEININIIDDNGAAPLHNAAFRGHSNCVKLMLNAGAIVNPVESGQTTPLHHAAFGGHVECVSMLISHGAEVGSQDGEGATPLHKSSFMGKIDAMQSLLEHGADLSIQDEEGSTSLHKAAYCGQVEAIELLLQYGAEIDCQDISDGTPLHNACFSGHLPAVKLLVTSQANLNCADSKGASPLHLAVLNGHLDVASYLLDYGAVVDAPDDRGMIVLHFAIAHSNCLEFILNRETSIQVDYRDKSGRTPLFYASKNSCDDSCRLLISRGADINAKDNSGKTPFEVASTSFQKVLMAANKERESQLDSETQKKYSQAAKLFNQKPSKGIEFLTSNGLITGTSQEIAEFLYKIQQLNKKSIGAYLGDIKANLQVLKDFVGLMDFVDLDFDDALRLFLSKFALPGEAQQIDKIMEAFATQYCKHNPTIFGNQDSAYILAFSLIMLNTDLHNPQVKNKMSQADFIKRTRPIIDQNIPDEMLPSLYDKIAKNEIKMQSDTTSMFGVAEKKGWCSKQGGRFKTWKKRWFVLKDNCLYYFKSQQPDEQPCGIIPLENVQVRVAEKADRKNNCFEVYSSDGDIKACKFENGQLVRGHHLNYLISAPSPADMESWIAVITANVAFNPLNELLKARQQQAASNNRSSSSGKGMGDRTVSTRKLPASPLTSSPSFKGISPSIPMAELSSLEFSEFHDACVMCSVVGRSTAAIKETYGTSVTSTGDEGVFRCCLITNNNTKTQHIIFVGGLTDMMAVQANAARADVVKVVGLERALESFSILIKLGLKNGYSVEVYGHSLGGSLALLWAQKAATKPRRVITFGQPKIAKLKDKVSFNGIPITRIVDSSDSIADHFKDFISIGTVVVLFPETDYAVPTGDQVVDSGVDKRADGNSIEVYLKNLKTKINKKPTLVSKVRSNAASSWT
eukprot:TRINITY_DN1157_c0_g1_i1.p1 TRINITY_DN1157_c0_g1~~TRINITY_DN1157_c0_g1_i1.p1  ORF type:complete len:1157 (+),score=243.01 TRINITY_DN1157_c0_g1_i1:169-3639(+)